MTIAMGTSNHSHRQPLEAGCVAEGGGPGSFAAL
jgi:hypothetical protein